MATYRISPQFIFVFISAAILLAFFIHRYQMATRAVGEISQSSQSPPVIENSIEEIPNEWVDKVETQ